MRKNLFPLFALWLLVIISCVCGKTDQFSRRTSQDANQPAIKVTAIDLFRAYKDNEVAADERYKGKILEVSGAVDNIGKDIMDTPYVTLDTGDVISTVQCMFGDEHKAELASLKKGDRVTIKGECQGKLGNVLLRDSTLTSR
jgi:hypothetical protein